MKNLSKTKKILAVAFAFLGMTAIATAYTLCDGSGDYVEITPNYSTGTATIYDPNNGAHSTSISNAAAISRAYTASGYSQAEC